ncbi:helix-turn-helix transcriptional regulator [Paenibacillus sp. UMB4589-SE434]|uniref:helix-turn-helix transcriptional regulator n=1 Tax=Paenibacillus sp. UMB4589-SE434 TaxID=3046314 RepID=UPI00254EEC18|nr:helix-turn-helix transcriptional regulator [Paenibacillus sp. UMB4589-SE434]MDK8179619.1 helix-turn-helix transcriptional regulator [Paenibacillus sp. UMB4589-SE434]
MLENKSDSIVNKVYEFRVLKRMSQSDLAEVVGVSKQTIFVMEKNNYFPSLLLAYRIANFFGVSIEEIFTYKKGGNENVE